MGTGHPSSYFDKLSMRKGALGATKKSPADGHGGAFFVWRDKAQALFISRAVMLAALPDA